jgi:Tfp pilus assembly protein PilN
MGYGSAPGRGTYSGRRSAARTVRRRYGMYIGGGLLVLILIIILLILIF